MVQSVGEHKQIEETAEQRRSDRVYIVAIYFFSKISQQKILAFPSLYKTGIL